MQEMKPDGIEANYIYIDRNHRRIDETAIWNEFARQHQLCVTTGSDFHRSDGIHPEIGMAESAARFYTKHGFRITDVMEGNDYYYLRYPVEY